MPHLYSPPIAFHAAPPCDRPALIGAGLVLRLSYSRTASAAVVRSLGVTAPPRMSRNNLRRGSPSSISWSAETMLRPSRPAPLNISIALRSRLPSSRCPLRFSSVSSRLPAASAIGARLPYRPLPTLAGMIDGILEGDSGCFLSLVPGCFLSPVTPERDSLRPGSSFDLLPAADFQIGV